MREEIKPTIFFKYTGIYLEIKIFMCRIASGALCGCVNGSELNTISGEDKIKEKGDIFCT